MPKSPFKCPNCYGEGLPADEVPCRKCGSPQVRNPSDWLAELNNISEAELRRRDREADARWQHATHPKAKP